MNQEIVTYSVEFATKPGDNYLSSIYRVSVVTKEEGILSRIVKTIIEKPESREVISALKVFPKEMLVYEEFLPHFERQFYQQTREKVSFSPQCYYTANEPLPLIVLNDLKAQGYELRDRRIGLSVREVRMVLEKVAKFHACSVKRFEEVTFYDYFSNMIKNTLHFSLDPTLKIFLGMLGFRGRQKIWKTTMIMPSRHSFGPLRIILKMENVILSNW